MGRLDVFAMLFLLTVNVYVTNSQHNGSCSNPEVVDIIFLIDGSSSINPPDFEQVKAAIETFINKNECFGKTRVQIGIIQFSTEPRVEFQLDQYDDKAVLLKAVHQIQQLHGGTNTGQALNFTIDYFDSSKGGRPGIQQYLILITDGESGDHVSEAARAIRDRGLNVFAIGIGSANHAELVTISGSHENAFHLDNFDTLKDLEQWISFEARSPNACSHPEVADTIFLIDGSSSISPPDFEKVKKVIETFINKNEVGKTRVQIGIIQFSTKPRLEFQLDQYDDKAVLLKAVHQIQQLHGGTNTGQALNFTIDYFDSSKGGRPGIQQYLILITDGESGDHVSEAARAIRDRGLNVFAIGIGSANHAELVTISGSQEKAFHLDNFDTLKDLEQWISFEARSPNACSHPEVADTIFLIDGSSSISPPDFEKVKKVIETFINKNEVGKTRVQIGIIQFSTKPRLEFQLDQYDDKAVLLKAVHQIQQLHGGTNTGQALNFTIDYFDSSKGGRPGIQQYLILITDGESGDHVSEAARAIRDRGLNVFAIGIGSANHAELVTISGSQEKAFHLDNFDTLKDLEQWISFEARSPNACSNPEVVDVIFLIDGSSSIQPSDFVKVRHFAEALINKTEVAESGVQIGVIQFSTKPHLAFQLDQYDDKAKLLKAVHQIQQLGGGTNTGQALNFTIDYFDSSKGGRPGIQQYLILITDGESGDHVSEAARAIRDRGVNVFAIGIGAANNDQLVMISGSEANIYNIDGYDALMSLEELISLDVCNPFAGCKRIKVADIVFVMDGSDSITAVQFKSMRDFIMAVVNHSEVDTGNVRFGAIVYGNNTQTIFQLDQFTSKAEIRNAVFGLRKTTGGSRYTAKALKEAKKLLSAENGGRPQSNPKVPQFIILVTNGPVTDSKDIPPIAEAFRNNGVGVYAIGVKGANKRELVDITGSNDNYLPALGFGFLYHLSSTVTHVLCAET